MALLPMRSSPCVSPMEVTVFPSPEAVGVVAVTSGQGAERAGLRAGDVITAVAGAQTTDTTALSQALAAAKPGDTVTVTVSRDGQERNVQVTLGELPGS